MTESNFTTQQIFAFIAHTVVIFCTTFISITMQLSPISEEEKTPYSTKFGKP